MFVLCSTIFYLSITEEEKMYVCTGDEVKLYPNYTFMPMKEDKKTIAFTYKITKSMIGKSSVIDVDGWSFYEFRQNDGNHGDIVWVTNSIIGGSKFIAFRSNVTFNFDRITKNINFQHYVPAPNNPGYETLERTFDGSCVVTTKG